jgi:urease accessory protein UreE
VALAKRRRRRRRRRRRCRCGASVVVYFEENFGVVDGDDC